MAKRIKVEQSDPPKSKTVLAEAIVSIGAAAKKLGEDGLNEDAIITLLHRKCQCGRNQIEIVLNGLKQLESWYCKPK